MNSILLENFKPKIASISSADLIEGTYRLDGQFYALFEDNFSNLTATSSISLIDCCSELYEVPPFKHIYTKKGVPFYTSSDLFNSDLIASHNLTPDMPNLETYRIKEKQVLMARSGNVESGILGQLLIAGKLLDGKTTSDHVIRFTVNTKVVSVGYFAAFLMSEFCKGQLLKNAAGAVIPAIRPESLKEIKIPLVSINIQNEIDNKMLKAVSNRENAILLLEKSRSLVLKYNNLPPLSETVLETIDPDKEVEIRSVNTAEFTHDYRFDAHFYKDIFKKASENIMGNASENLHLNMLSKSIFMGNRFIRNYVDLNNGIPLFGTKNIMQVRPNDLKFLSKTETSGINELILQKEWILVARSGSLGGTFGKVGYVWNNFEEYCGSEHIIRICPDKLKIDPAYLFAHLSSDYGYLSIIQLRHGALIDEIDPEDLGNILIPIPTVKRQKEIGDLVRQAYDLRAEAIKLEDEAQKILTEALTGK